MLRGEGGEATSLRMASGSRLVAAWDLRAVRAERDVFDGGAGVDTLGYAGRRRGVVVDLASHGRDAGALGEGDSLRRLEKVVGTDGDDRLFGDESPNALDGGAAMIWLWDGVATTGFEGARGQIARGATPAMT